LASAVEARKLAPHRYVTKAMHEVEFHEPVFVGDLVDFYTETVRIGRTSVTVRVSVEAERWGSVASEHGPIRRGERVKVTEAEVVLVAVNELGRPIPIRPETPTA
jgi:acyl-CoA thioesterase YciA